MPDTLTPAEQLRAAATRLRVPLALPFELALARLLDIEAAATAGDEDHSGCTVETCTTIAALAVARALLGGAE